MIDVSISINGINVEGVSPSSVKLTINNSDPLKFTDRTVAYSASVSVPRTEVNDRIFKEMRTPWLFVKQKNVCGTSFIRWFACTYKRW